jgi:hypothetical protein
MITLPLIATFCHFALVAPYSSKASIYSAKSAKEVILVADKKENPLVRVEYIPEPPLPIFPGTVTEVNPPKL